MTTMLFIMTTALSFADEDDVAGQMLQNLECGL